MPKLFVSTVSADVEIPELGIKITHPTTDYEIDAQFNAEEVREAYTLTSAIQAGTLIWRKSAGGANQPAADYDYDYLEVEELAGGPGSSNSRLIRTVGNLSRGVVPRWNDLLQQWEPSGEIKYEGLVQVPDTITTTLNGEHLLSATADRYVHVAVGTATGFSFRFPDATALQLGQSYLVHNLSSEPVNSKFNDGTVDLIVNPGSQIIYILQNNATQNGVWLRTLKSSAQFQGTAPVLSQYNGNANVGRYLEIFQGQGSDTAPFTLPVNMSIVALEFSTTAAATATLGVFKLSDLVNPVYSISLANQLSKIDLNLNVELDQNDQMALRITVATGSVSKPRAAMYLSA